MLSRPLFNSLIVEQSVADGIESIAFACFHIGYSTLAGKILCLMALYVRPAYRNKGVGQRLFLELLRLAKNWDCHRIDFDVNLENDLAIEFYEKTGAINCTKNRGWHVFQLLFN